MRNMASHRTDRTKTATSNAGDVSKIDLLLHPELLSQEFIQLMLRERKIAVGDEEDRELLTDLYLRHVIPLPQRDLPGSRWGRRMERSRAHSSRSDSGRKRPLIVFDSSSTNTGSVKLKKPDPSPAPVTTDRLKPPVSSISLTNPIRKLSGTSTNSSSNSSNRTPVSSPGAGPKSPCNHSKTANSSVHSNNTMSKLKRTSPSDGEPNTSDIKSPDTKKKIKHITWP
ncbi:ashwin-like isoform X2 [Sinocyclocheilus rhinocerous]|uniref:ashwin-like isoform X2 n=1 Tax=Sinocyclocheilus rhinocerous TaxID=307959 RepID=UPI0007BA453C|nr:PREDICTED: ashwin-like isoform X2 [Sinocyclocheilus rhinocerous]